MVKPRVWWISHHAYTEKPIDPGFIEVIEKSAYDELERHVGTHGCNIALVTQERDELQERVALLQGEIDIHDKTLANFINEIAELKAQVKALKG